MTSVWRGATNLTGRGSVIAARVPRTLERLLDLAEVTARGDTKIYRRPTAGKATAIGERARRFLQGSPQASLRVDQDHPVFVDPEDAEAFLRSWRALLPRGRRGIVVTRHIAGDVVDVLVAHGQVLAAHRADRHGSADAELSPTQRRTAAQAATAVPGFDLAEVTMIIGGPDHEGAHHEVVTVRPSPDLSTWSASEDDPVLRQVARLHVRALEEVRDQAVSSCEPAS